jgi:hypothetical protein
VNTLTLVSNVVESLPREGTRLAVALQVIQPERPDARCDCRYGYCDFTVPRVRFYLVIWRQALLAREPFEVIWRDQTSQSRIADPAIRGGRGDQGYARTIAWSLEQARDVGHIPLTAWNAAKIAAYLCPERWSEAGD